MISPFTKKLLKWHSAIHRPFPWKGEKNPYLIWLSEVILQQTRTGQGLPYYLKFKKRFPNVKSLAEASEDEVMKLWQGLGYNTRARNLHEAAKYIHHELVGKFPDNYEGIRKLKGVGDYTAAAVASFAFNLPHPVVYGNVYRVLSRYFGIKIPIDTTEGKRKIQQLAEKLLSRDQPARYNQAIMDFGAVQCVSGKPDCGECPMKTECAAFLKNLFGKLPVKSKKIRQRHRYFHYLVIKEGEHVYLSKRTEKDIWENMYEFPLIEKDRAMSLSELRRSGQWKELFKGIRVKKIKFSGNFQQTLTHQKISASFFEIAVGKGFQKNGFLMAEKDFSEKFAFPGIISLYLSNK